MKDLKNIKSKLVEQVVAQLDNLDQVNTQELGEAIDMIKDISEAIYYCTIVKSMNTNNTTEEETEDLGKFINTVSNRAKEFSKCVTPEEKVLLRNSMIDLGNSISI